MDVLTLCVMSDIDDFHESELLFTELTIATLTCSSVKSGRFNWLMVELLWRGLQTVGCFPDKTASASRPSLPTAG